MNKKKKIFIILIILILVLVAVLITRNIVEQHKKDTYIYTSIEEFETPKDVIKYLGSEFVKQEASKSDEFELDIYLKFKLDLFTNDNVSNKEYYNKMMDMIAYVLDYKSFRLIDDEKELLIVVICDSENKRIKLKYINGDENYFGNTQSQKNLEEFEEIKITDLEIQSQELIDLINNDWKSTKLNLGTKAKSLGKYDIYEDGIEIRNVYKKVFNIVFNENYNKPVLNGITTKMKKEEIIEILGNPTIVDEKEDIFGYKSNNIYVFFTYGDISIYRVENYDTSVFVDLVKNYIEGTTNVKQFVSGITDTWPDYDIYDYDKNFVNLVYTLKGVKIQFNVTSNHGVIIYNNYTGEILEGMTTENVDLEKTKNKVFFENTNTLLENEINRIYYYEVEMQMS